MDRLSASRRHEASCAYRSLKKDGIKALNDPARFLGRFGLLRGLFRAGNNQFNAYRADEFEWPARWPVFLRLEGDHSAPISGLLGSPEELDQAMERAISEGAPRSALLIIEYAAEPTVQGVFRKLSVFRIGETLLGYTCVHDDNWIVKYGKLGVATQELYDEEYSFVANNTYGAEMRPAFDLAGIDYGRIDFGLVGGKPQVYEINCNPNIDLKPKAAPNARRNETIALFREQYISAMNSIDVSPRPRWQAQTSMLIRKSRAASFRIAGLLAGSARAGRSTAAV